MWKARITPFLCDRGRLVAKPFAERLRAPYSERLCDPRHAAQLRLRAAAR
jgi:hypothetical protein